MTRYKVMQFGICTHQWTSDFAGADYYESSFGKPQRWCPESQCSASDIKNSLGKREVKAGTADYFEYCLPAEYTIVSEDMTAELQAKAERLKIENAARDLLKNFNKAKMDPVVGTAIDALIIVLGLK